MLKPQIIEKPELKVVGCEATFISALSPDANNFKVIPPLWDKISQRADEIPNRAGKEMYGVMYAQPPAQRKHEAELQYIAGVSVSSIAKVPDGMSSRTIPPATFAVFTHRGPIQKIAETCYQIYRVWLPQSDYEHAGIADVELYDHRFDAYSDDSEMEYWISVKAKRSAR